ncbi:DUF21-domain-containing protein [Exidia glandulosa HHB12029]|uniref:DUF21-domain-containing protein n=1 Tax=Exidia glandulosa HHB12029 TaxID=1314781 RepID=A0A165GP07_EXIGL|nr:DUF21-domain-containing protein [Exidia glandulosa HHB12029]
MILRTTLSYLYYVYYEPHARSVSGDVVHHLAKRAEKHDGQFIAFAILIPVLVLLSGVFAGLTLGYMSLDETQLNVLSISGTPEQQKYAAKIKPIRHNGHLLLVTLLLANMIVNETLPVISDQVLGGGPQAVVASTAMIVIFSEIIPQSLCSRYGLYIGAKCAPFVRVLTWIFLPLAWPVAKLLELILGPHHGIIYRRGELKELIAMHSSVSPHGGDLKADTVTIIGHTLDLQEKVVRDAMTPIENVFMLHKNAKLDYETLAAVCKTGHSRIPVYDEVDLGGKTGRTVKRIIGILLVKQCVLLDPADATPVKSIPLNAVPSVPYDEPLLGILDRFQEGRSHMAIVSPIPKGRAASVKQVVKQSFGRRFMSNIGLGDDSTTDEDTTDDETAGSSGHGHHSFRRRSKKSPKGSPKHEKDLEKGNTGREKKRIDEPPVPVPKKVEDKKPPSMWAGMGRELEQTMPADAVLGKEGANRFLQGFEPGVAPIGIITLEDVLEELIGEEIFDEFDHSAIAHVPASEYVPPEALREIELAHRAAAAKSPAAASKKSVAIAAPAAVASQPSLAPSKSPSITLGLAPKVAQSLAFLRTRSAPPTPREPPAQLSVDDVPPLTLNTTDVAPNGIVPAPAGLGFVLEEHPTSNSAPASPTTTMQPSESDTVATVVAPSVTIIEPPPPVREESPAIIAPVPMPAARVRGSSRSSSPSPGLLSLIERRRRAAAAGSTSTPPGSTTALPVIGGPEAKTKRTPGFKSTPLNASALNSVMTPIERDDNDGGGGGAVKAKDMAAAAPVSASETADAKAGLDLNLAEQHGGGVEPGETEEGFK